MNFSEAWEKALSKTDIIRQRVQGLMTFQETKVPYIMLSESTINIGDTVVRKGEVVVEKPSLILPPNNPVFEGFEIDEKSDIEQGDMLNFLLIRGVSFPSLKYNNKQHSLDLYEGEVSSAIDHYLDLLAKKENVSTGLVKSDEDVWQFSLMIFICSQIARNANMDIQRLLDDHQKKGD